MIKFTKTQIKQWDKYLEKNPHSFMQIVEEWMHYDTVPDSIITLYEKAKMIIKERKK